MMAMHWHEFYALLARNSYGPSIFRGNSPTKQAGKIASLTHINAPFFRTTEVRGFGVALQTSMGWVAAGWVVVRWLSGLKVPILIITPHVPKFSGDVASTSCRFLSILLSDFVAW